ncbi:MAG TPA: metallophosphoesterase family protein [Vicinamibacterales bacterium]|nr:metallophosphoesterase family protein [Vicinamibacterales bacterium]
MRYFVITDIHANRQALDAVIEDAERLGYDEVLVLGDLVGYGGAPDEVIDRTLALKPSALIRGNHDKVCAGLESAALFNDVARVSAEWTASILTAKHRKLLADLKKGPILVSSQIEICHGAPFDEDHYIFDGGDAARAIDVARGRICLFGHTHVPAIYTTVGDPVEHAEELEEDELHLPKTGPALLNVGSVGQPRDGDPRAAYGLLDLQKNTLRLRRVPYDIKGAQTDIRNAGLPAWLGQRLDKGQ